jgi:hypothetical protein
MTPCACRGAICKNNGITAGAKSFCDRADARFARTGVVRRTAHRKEIDMKSATLAAALIAALALVLSAGCTSSGGGPAQGPGMSRYGGSGGNGGGGGGGGGY